MVFRVTPAQWRVLRHFWQTGEHFTLDSLLDGGVLHFHPLAHFCLYRMLLKHQIIPCGLNEFHDLRFVGTIASHQEWEEIVPGVQ